jgi:hypothetical protein
MNRRAALIVSVLLFVDRDGAARAVVPSYDMR